MNTPVRIFLAMLLVSAPAGALHAQSFSGTGSQRIGPLSLDAGVAVFDISHYGEGSFSVQVLNDEGERVGTLVDVRGAFAGTSALRVPAAGAYWLAVAASGAWQIGLQGETNVAPASLAETEEAAPERVAPWSWGWTARGLVGGALAGPIGTAVAFAMAGGSRVDLPEDASAAYREEMAERIRNRRREAAFVGGMIGTGIFAFVLLRLVDFSGADEVGFRPPTTEPI